MGGPLCAERKKHSAKPNTLFKRGFAFFSGGHVIFCSLLCLCGKMFFAQRVPSQAVRGLALCFQSINVCSGGLYAAELARRPARKGCGETNDAHSRVQKVTFVSVVLQRLTPLPNSLFKTTWVSPLIKSGVVIFLRSDCGGGSGEPAGCPRFIYSRGEIARLPPIIKTFGV